MPDLGGERRQPAVVIPRSAALRGAGLDTIDVAARLSVDPKTVQRWLTGRLPYPRHRDALARLTGWTVRDLWPHATPASEPPPGPTADEVIAVYPHRSAVPADAWRNLFAQAKKEVDILVYSGLSLAEDTAAMRVLRHKARQGVRVRLLLGDPDGQHIAQRGADEGIGAMMSARIRNALVPYRPLADEPGVGLRLHDTVLYNSIYRADDLILVNAHAYGRPASHAPVLRLRQSGPHSIATIYSESFARVWIGCRA